MQPLAVAFRNATIGGCTSRPGPQTSVIRTSAMTATLTVLFSAHLAGNLLAERYLSFGKGHSFLNPLSRAIAVVALSATLTGASDPRFLAILLATHVALAPVKVLNPPRSLPALALNGLIRWAAIVALSASFEDAFANGWWASLLTQELQR